MMRPTYENVFVDLNQFRGYDTKYRGSKRLPGHGFVRQPITTRTHGYIPISVRPDMMKNLCNILYCMIAAVGIGCSGFDSNAILHHPEEVLPGGTMDAVLLNLYVYLTGESEVTESVVRDSLHLLVGTPETWEVTGAKMAVAGEMKTGQLLSFFGNELEPGNMESLIVGSVSAAGEMSGDPSMAESFTGRTITAKGHNAENSDLEIDIDEVSAWKGFSAPVNITLAKGDRADTVIALDSLLAWLESGGLVESASSLKNPLAPDSIGITIVPVLIFVSLKAAGTEGIDTLYYFSKTASMGSSPNPLLGQLSPEYADLELGDMTYAPVRVSSTIHVRSGRDHVAASLVSATPDPFSGTVSIDLTGLDLTAVEVGIFALNGAPLCRLVPDAGEARAVWNGRDRRGNTVRPGTYVIRIQDGDRAVSRSVRLMR